MSCNIALWNILYQKLEKITVSNLEKGPYSAADLAQETLRFLSASFRKTLIVEDKIYHDHLRWLIH